MCKINIKLYYSIKDVYRRSGKRVLVDNKFTYFKSYPSILKEENTYGNIVYGSNICLKSIFGYIPIDNIKSYISLFNPNNYCKDVTDMTFSYEETYKNKDDIENIDRLSKKLGRFWKNT